MIEVKQNEPKADGKELLRQITELTRQCGEKWEQFCELQDMRTKLRQQIEIGHPKGAIQNFSKAMLNIVEEQIEAVRQEVPALVQEFIRKRKGI